MRPFLHRRPSPSLAIAIAAVVIASTGSAVAATLVTTKQIKDGTIGLADLSAAVKAGLAGGRGPQGPVGPAGANGTSGTNGTNGKDGAPGPIGPQGGPAAITTANGLTTLNAGTQDLMSLSLPAGTWYVSSHLGGAYNGTTASARLECSINEPGGSDGDFGKLRFPPNTDATNSLVFADMSLHAVVVLAATTTVKTTCSVVQATATFTMTAHKMTAIKMTGVTRQ